MNKTEIILRVVFVIWYVGFLVFYGIIYRPKSDTWGAWMRNAFFSLTWPLTPIWMVVVSCILRNKQRKK